MSEREFILLCTLMGDGENEVADSKMKALTIEEIMIKANDDALCSVSTVYKNVQKLVNKGYVRRDGITKGRSFTYYLTEAGKKYIESV